MQGRVKNMVRFAVSYFQKFHLWVSQNVRGAVVAERGVCATRHEKQKRCMKPAEMKVPNPEISDNFLEFWHQQKSFLQKNGISFLDGHPTFWIFGDSRFWAVRNSPIF